MTYFPPPNFDILRALDTLVALNEQPLRTKIKWAGSSFAFAGPREEALVQEEMLEQVVYEASHLFQNQKITLDFYEKLCRSLFKLDASYGYENERIHNLGMFVYREVLEAYESQRKSLTINILSYLHGALPFSHPPKKH